MLELPAPVAIVCHDSGAANIIIAWLRAEPRGRWQACMRGPAAKLYAEVCGASRGFETIDAALAGARTLLSGTGWASGLEHEARCLARERGIRSIAVIDHWVNYKERFTRHGKTVLPDEIWVTDEAALAEARRCFPDHPLKVQPNLYLRAQVEAIRSQAADPDPRELLYVLEPTRADWGRGVPGEFQALDFFLSNRVAVGLPADASIRLRPHPSDRAGKYAPWVRERVRLDDSATLAAAIARAQWVAGCESFALVVALEAGRQVICTLPPWAPQCRLPHAGLIHLKRVV